MRTKVYRVAARAAATASALAITGYAMALSGPGADSGTASRQSASTAAASMMRSGGPARPASHQARATPPGGTTGRGTAGTTGQGRTSALPSRSDRSAPRRLDVGGRALSSAGIVVAKSAQPLPAVPASAYVIANAHTGQVLAAKDAHGLFPPASTLKVLTAITMLPRLRPGATITASRLAASMVPNIIGLIPGVRYRVADLFRSLLLISANDAAVSLVEASGSFARGMALVNAEAQHLRAYDVVAKTPNGLPAPGQVVSAYDLALIGRAALGNPAFMHYDGTRSAMFYNTRFGPVHMVNENGLLTQYPGALGGKIGWTATAGATYLGMARRHGVTLIVSILHATPLTEITSAEKLLNWGFTENRRIRPVGTLVRPASG